MMIYVLWGWDQYNAKRIEPFLAFKNENEAKKYCKEKSGSVVYYYTKLWLND